MSCLRDEKTPSSDLAVSSLMSGGAISGVIFGGTAEASCICPLAGVTTATLQTNAHLQKIALPVATCGLQANPAGCIKHCCHRVTSATIHWQDIHDMRALSGNLKVMMLQYGKIGGFLWDLKFFFTQACMHWSCSLWLMQFRVVSTISRSLPRARHSHTDTPHHVNLVSR